MGSFFTPLNMSSLCGALWWVSSASSLSVVAMSCPSSRLLAQPDPLRRRLRLPARGLGNDLAHLPHVRQGHFAAAQAADEPDHLRPVLRLVERRADLGGDDARMVRRAQREV